MPVMHCMKCDHEWESTSERSLCDWCGEAGYVLAKKTPLEKAVKAMKDKKIYKAILGPISEELRVEKTKGSDRSDK